MNDFIKKNEALLKFYHFALRLSGWLLLTIGIFSYVIVIILARNLGPKMFGITVLNMPLRGFELILFGLLGLGTSQLMRYLYDYDYKAGFILRNAGKLICVYLILIFIVMVIRNVYTIRHLTAANIENSIILYLSTSLSSVVLFAAKVLILVGVAQFLKRLLPIIEESKALV